jgi:sugar phosphate isomerase/epimerase
MDRRDFLSGAALTAAAALAAKDVAFPTEAAAQEALPQKLVTQLWSRHLQWVGTQAEQVADPYGTGVKVGEACLAAGFAAVDLTVRNDGHVHPSNVATHLPPMLQGIRSTGAICDQIGVNFAPPADKSNTEWISTQFVHEILSVANAHGIRKYRYNNSGAVGFGNNTFQDQMVETLDAVRVNHKRLAAINAQYGRMCGVAHTHAGNIGVTVYDYAYSMDNISPELLGINLAIGHTASAAPGTMWQLEIRRNIKHIKAVAVEDLRATVNASTGALSISRVQPPGSTGNGGGVINWATFYTLLRLGGYSGPVESQIEYTITGANGNNVSLNSAFFANHAQFVSGNLTPAIMIAAMKMDSDFIRQRALAGGWTEAQIV